MKQALKGRSFILLLKKADDEWEILNGAVEEHEGVRGVEFSNIETEGMQEIFQERKVSGGRWSGRCNKYYLYMNRKLLENGVVFGEWQSFQEEADLKKMWKFYVENMLKFPGFLKGFWSDYGFLLGFLDRVVLKCLDVSEGRTTFLFRIIKLPCLDSSVTGVNMYV